MESPTIAACGDAASAGGTQSSPILDARTVPPATVGGAANEPLAAWSGIALQDLQQSAWFQVLVLVLFLSAGPTFYLWRVHQLEPRRAAQEAFSRQLTDSQEQERRRIAAELHNSLGQTLLVVRNVALIGAGSQAANGPVAAQFRETCEASAVALAEVRSISPALRPVELDWLDLSKSIGAAAQRMGEAARIRFDLQIDRADGLLPAEKEIQLYRIVQECLHKVIKHSQARSVLVELSGARATFNSPLPMTIVVSAPLPCDRPLRVWASVC